MALPVSRPANGRPLVDVLDSAVGRAHRHDPVLGRSGGPAGNARVTAWLGLLLLGLFLVELATLLSLRQWISLHIGLGAALAPLVVAKTFVTGWRILRYYAGDGGYVAAGPPPLLLRLLGPLVVLTGLAVVGSGLALVPLGRDGTRAIFATVVGQRLSPLTVHQACFAGWLVVAGIHTLTRLVPALRLVSGRTTSARVPGASVRGIIVAATLAAAAVVGVVVTDAAGSWTNGSFAHERFHHDHDRFR